MRQGKGQKSSSLTELAQVLVLPLTCYVILCRYSYSLSVRFLLFKMGTIVFTDKLLSMSHVMYVKFQE